MSADGWLAVGLIAGCTMLGTAIVLLAITCHKTAVRVRWLEERLAALRVEQERHCGQLATLLKRPDLP